MTLKICASDKIESLGNHKYCTRRSTNLAQSNPYKLKKKILTNLFFKVLKNVRYLSNFGYVFIAIVHTTLKLFWEIELTVSWLWF